MGMLIWAIITIFTFIFSGFVGGLLMIVIGLLCVVVEDGVKVKQE